MYHRLSSLFRILLSCFLFFLLPFHTSTIKNIGQKNGSTFLRGNPYPSGKQAYSGKIKETEPRLSQLQTMIKLKQPIPKDLTLLYSEKKGNYLIFYDIEGRNAYYRYRRDRFDEQTEKKIPKPLIKGQSYRIKGMLEGLLYKGKLLKKDSKIFIEKLESTDSLLIFRFISAIPRYMENLLL